MAENLVTVGCFWNLFDAQLSKIRLESMGIDWFLVDEATVQANWLYSFAIGGIKLQVRESDAERALGILGRETLSPDLPESGVSEEKRERLCPQCNSLRIFYEPRPDAALTLFLLLALLPLLVSISYVFFFLVILPLLLPDGIWKCDECGHEWRVS